jgi:hypothetical protein
MGLPFERGVKRKILNITGGNSAGAPCQARLFFAFCSSVESNRRHRAGSRVSRLESRHV